MYCYACQLVDLFLLCENVQYMYMYIIINIFVSIVRYGNLVLITQNGVYIMLLQKMCEIFILSRFYNFLVNLINCYKMGDTLHH